MVGDARCPHENIRSWLETDSNCVCIVCYDCGAKTRIDELLFSFDPPYLPPAPSAVRARNILDVAIKEKEKQGNAAD